MMLCKWPALYTSLLVVLAGCALNPATGERDFMLLTQADEQRLGAREHSKIIAQFGGDYCDHGLCDYVTRIGRKLAAFSKLPAETFTFTILDSDIVNAFALPGGYVYVTRGLIALAENEAELASVVAHEIAHITARHSAQRYSKQVVADLGVGLLGALSKDSELTDIASLGGTLYLRSYSREQEFQADILGIRYLGRAGYDMHAMAGFLGRMAAHGRFQAQLRGGKNSHNRFDMMATHPRTVARVRQARQEAKVTDKFAPTVGRRRFMNALDGLAYGGSARHGFVRAGRFIHPELGFAFDIPPGYHLENHPQRIILGKAGKPTIVFDTIANNGQSLKNYLLFEWGKQLRLTKPEDITINGLQAVTAASRALIRGQVTDMRFIVLRFAADRLVRFLILDTSERLKAASTEIRRMTYSFRSLSAAQKRRLKPPRVRVEKVATSADLHQLWRRMQVVDFPKQRFDVLNGIKTGRQIKPGDLIKIVR